MRTKRLLLLVIVLACVLPACRPRLGVVLATAAETLPAPSFVVAEKSHPDTPRFHTIEVYNEAKELVWHARAEPFGLPDVSEPIRYGLPPAGFVDVEAPQALEVGKRYSLVVSGRGFGALKIAVASDGRVSAVKRRG